MRKITTVGVLTALLTVLVPASLVAPADAARTKAPVAAARGTARATSVAAGPAGRSTYVMAVLGGPNTAMYSRLSMYTFASNGTMSERYWAWRQNNLPISEANNAASFKVPSGYTTTGCLRVCPVKTPVGFQRGTAPSTNSGIWYINTYGLVIRFGTAFQVWRLDSSQPGFVGATFLGGNQQIQKGWGFGSNAGPYRGATMRQIYASTYLRGPLAANLYGVPTVVVPQGFHFPDLAMCTTGRCMQGKAVRAADRRSWFHIYLAGNPAVDGRKNYNNSQTGVVQQMESPGSVCISVLGGHTSAMLQIIDDSGHFRGWVGAEVTCV